MQPAGRIGRSVQHRLHRRLQQQSRPRVSGIGAPPTNLSAGLEFGQGALGNDFSDSTGNLGGLSASSLLTADSVAAVANALTGAALAVATWALAAHGLSRGRARVAGLLVALHPGMVIEAALVMSEPLAALLVIVAFWLAVRDGRPWRGVSRRRAYR